MNNALGMNQNFDLIHINTKEPFCFHNFQTFIHQGRRIYGNLIAHTPVRMFQSICRCYFQQFFSFLSAERTTGSSQKDSFDFVILIALQRLENSRMFTIHRIDFDIMLFRQIHNQLTRRNKCFLVGQCNIFACTDCFKCRLQTYITYNGCYNCIHTFIGCRFHQTIHAADNTDIHVRKSVLQFFCILFIHNSYQFRLIFSSLFFQQTDVAVTCNSHYSDIF